MVAQRMIRNFHRGTLIACALILVGAARVQAEVRITATEGDTITIEARDATLRDVLDALAKTHKLDFRSPSGTKLTVVGLSSAPLVRAPAVAYARPAGPRSNVDLDEEKAMERAGVAAATSGAR